MLSSNAYEKHELKSAELHAYKIVHLFFRCSGEQENLDIICKLPGVVTIRTLTIFAEVSDTVQLLAIYKWLIPLQSSPDAKPVHHVLANQGYAVANLFDAADSVELEEILDKFKTGQAKVLFTQDCKTRAWIFPPAPWSLTIISRMPTPIGTFSRSVAQVKQAALVSQ